MDANSPTIPQSPNGSVCGPSLQSSGSPSFVSGGYPTAALLYASQLSQSQLSPFINASTGSSIISSSGCSALFGGTAFWSPPSDASFGAFVKLRHVIYICVTVL